MRRALRGGLLPLLPLLLLAALPASLLAVPSAAAGRAHDPAAGRPHGPVPVVGRDLGELRRALERGEVTSVQLVDAYLRRIDAYEDAYADQPGINAVISVDRRAARAGAARLDAERAAGRVRGPLHGIPLVLKDNYDTADTPTTSGSLALRELRPRRDATQVRRLREAGAIVLAKTNMHEFAMSVTTLSSLGGQTRNPYDQTRHPGGSSGGTGAAVAAAFAPAGMGTDTCGSIRIPASHNNLVGLRPTLGLSSRAGIAPLAGTQDTAGPMTVSVRDAALLLDATAGHDPRDPVTEAARGKVPRSYLDGLSRDALRGKRVGVFTDYFGAEDEAAPTNAVVREAVADMARSGATPVELGAQPDIMEAAAGANRVRDEFERDLNAYLAESADGHPRSLARLEPPRDEITLADIATSGQVTPSVLETLRAWVNSPPLPNPAYEEKLRQRDVLRTLLTELMREHRLDALVYPSVSRPPTPVGTTQPYANCRLSGYSGFPALSVPAGFTGDGLPVGVELLGRPFDEPGLLAMGYAYEQATRHRTPPTSTPPLAD
ncbi:amidase family protein [Streptomyces daliensis]|uniref:Amidase n=1 Tax=Streptomyces daliensis TaxID=299421 RepID=A0A8T4INA7_9ACTN|nr:amidase [Streptomyces daliensis]